MVSQMRGYTKVKRAVFPLEEEKTVLIFELSLARQHSAHLMLQIIEKSPESLKETNSYK